MTITTSEDKLLFFLATGMDIKTLIDNLETNYLYALANNYDTAKIEAINDQITFLKTSRYICSSAAKFLLHTDLENLN